MEPWYLGRAPGWALDAVHVAHDGAAVLVRVVHHLLDYGVGRASQHRDDGGARLKAAPRDARAAVEDLCVHAELEVRVGVVDLLHDVEAKGDELGIADLDDVDVVGHLVGGAQELVALAVVKDELEFCHGEVPF